MKTLGGGMVGHVTSWLKINTHLEQHLSQGKGIHELNEVLRVSKKG